MLAIPLIQKIVGGIALALVILLSIMWQVERRHAAKLQAQVISLSAQLQSITTARDEQKPITKANVEKVVHQSSPVAERIERAPTEAGCKTPEIILGADL